MLMLVYTNDYTQIDRTNTIKFNSPSHIRHERSKFNKGSAMDEAVSHRSLTAQDRVQLQLSPCGICGRKSGTGTSFSSNSLFFFSMSVPFQ